jgi:hypothetical protein
VTSKKKSPALTRLFHDWPTGSAVLFTFSGSPQPRSQLEITVQSRTARCFCYSVKTQFFIYVMT